MNDIRNITIGILAIAIAILGYSTRGVNSVIPSQKVGSVASPDFMSPYISFGGVRHWAGHIDGATAATSTPCAIQSPSATSTLVMGSFEVASTSASATYIEMGRATTPYATTTSLGTVALGANAQATLISLRTAGGGDALAETFPPNTYLVVKVGGSVTTQINGECNASWIEN